MNTFATIEEAMRFRFVTFYSIRIDGDEETLFVKFLNRHVKYEFELDHIREWLSYMGTRRGAQLQFFRFEREAHALPPPVWHNENTTECKLRLYCMRLSNDVVILFSGGMKTKLKAQHCPNVAGPFREANKWTQAIQNAIAEGDISVDKNSLIMDSDFKLWLP